MSSTNRGATRIGQDFYPTPLTAFNPLMPYIKQLPQIRYKDAFNGQPIVFEPACGDGRLVSAMNVEGIPAYGDDLINGYDFLLDETKREIIVTNPPFSLAKEFIERALKNSHDVFMLLRLNFLGSLERHDWWKDHSPSALFVLSKRPNFVISAKCLCGFSTMTYQMEDKDLIPSVCPACQGKVKKGSSDSTEYAWYYWGPNFKGIYFLK